MANNYKQGNYYDDLGKLRNSQGRRVSAGNGVANNWGRGPIVPEGAYRGSGIDRHRLLQDPSVRAFPDRRYPGDSADEMARDLNRDDMRVGPGGGFEPNRNFSPREQRMLIGGGGGQRRPKPFNTPEQERWARRAAENSPPEGKNPSGAPGEDPPPAGKGSKRGRVFTRSENVDNAARSGDNLGFIRDKYNKDNKGSGYSMGSYLKNFEISYNPAKNTNSRDMLRDSFNAKMLREKGEEPVRSTGKNPVTGKDTGFAIVNPHGSAVSKVKDRSKFTGGTMTKPITGEKVKMREYLSDESAFLDKKYGHMPTKEEYEAGITQTDKSTIGGDELFGKGGIEPKKTSRLGEFFRKWISSSGNRGSSSSSQGPRRK